MDTMPMVTSPEAKKLNNNLIYADPLTAIKKSLIGEVKKSILLKRILDKASGECETSTQHRFHKIIT
jgi:hypothetical protein